MVVVLKVKVTGEYIVLWSLVSNVLRRLVVWILFLYPRFYSEWKLAANALTQVAVQPACCVTVQLKADLAVGSSLIQIVCRVLKKKWAQTVNVTVLGLASAAQNRDGRLWRVMEVAWHVYSNFAIWLGSK